MSDCRTNCTCVIPDGQRTGWCERHRMKKTAALVQLCKTNPKYFAKWDKDAKNPPGANGGRLVIPQKACKPPIGPGTELKLILKRLLIEPKGNCKCNQRAKEMDANGPDWCEEHIEEIIDWLEEEAKKRHMTLVFSRIVARRLIRMAITNARKKLAMLEHQ